MPCPPATKAPHHLPPADRTNSHWCDERSAIWPTHHYLRITKETYCSSHDVFYFSVRVLVNLNLLRSGMLGIKMGRSILGRKRVRPRIPMRKRIMAMMIPYSVFKNIMTKEKIRNQTLCVRGKQIKNKKTFTLKFLLALDGFIIVLVYTCICNGHQPNWEKIWN